MWSQKSKKHADKFIMSWIIRAESSGIKMLVKFAKTIRTHFKRILAHYEYPISTGILEGTNNKIKTLSRQSYGFRDSDYFKVKIMAIHRSKYQLTG
jgi:transposase